MRKEQKEEYITSNLNLTSLLLALNKAQIVKVIPHEGRKDFVLTCSPDFRKTIIDFSNGMKFSFSPLKLFQALRQLKALIYDGG